MDFVLGQVVKDGAAASIDEKVEREAEMLRVIAKLPSGIEQDHYLKKTAEALNVDEATLRQDMAKQRTAHAGPLERTATGTTAATVQRPRAEEMLIHLMLKDDDVARVLQGQISPSDFTDPLFKRAAEQIFNVLATGKTLDLRTLKIEGDEELSKLITYYLVRDFDWERESEPSKREETKNKNIKDCVHLIKQQDSEAKLNALSKALIEAEAKGDWEEHRRLQEIQRDLSKRPGRSIPGRGPGSLLS
jgi:DNA primase